MPADALRAFGIPAGWAQHTQDQALDTTLVACRDSEWAHEPATSSGLVSAQVSSLFRTAEYMVYPERVTQRLNTMLGLHGHTLSDTQCIGGDTPPGSGQALSEARDFHAGYVPADRLIFHSKYPLQWDSARLVGDLAAITLMLTMCICDILFKYVRRIGALRARTARHHAPSN